MAGAVGIDDHGGAALHNLIAAGVNISHVARKGAATGVASIFVAEKGDNMIISIPGANYRVGSDDVDRLVEKLSAGDHLVLQLEIPASTVEYALKVAKWRGIKTLLNTAPFTIDAVRLSKLADIVVMNESEMAEAARLTETADGDVQAAFRALFCEDEKLLVVTKGEAGAIACDGKSILSVAALPIKPVDTVGAGDTFVGYLAAGLHARLPINTALQQAVVAASLACTKRGAQSGIPFAEEVRGASL